MAECDSGFDANFVTDIHDLLKCVVCNFVLKNPVQVIECGHRFCRICYEKMKEYALTREVDLLCPLDRLLIDEKEVFPDKGIERRILDLQVKCDHFNDGCEWINELRLFQDHNNNECLFALVCCPNDGCNINSVRSELEEHKKICPMKEGSPAQTIRKLETTMSEVMERLKAKDEQLDALKIEMKENEANSKTMISEVMERLKAKDDQLGALTVQMKENEANSKTMISEVMERLKAKDDQLGALTVQMKENEANSKTMISEVMERLKAKDEQLGALTVQMKENEANSKTMISEVMDTLKTKDDQLDALTLKMKENEMHLKTMEKKLEVLDKTIGVDEKYQGLRGEINALKLLQETKLLGYFQWNITNYSTQKRSLNRIDSLPFSTLNGYNCFISVQWTGLLREYFGIYIYLKAGERDDDLVWPFNMKVTFECCNGDHNVKHTLDCYNPEVHTWGNKPDPTNNSGGIGFKNFLTYPHNKFFKDDSIVINCYIETMDEK